MYNGVKKENYDAFNENTEDLDSFLLTLPSCSSREKLDRFVMTLLTSHNTIEAKDKLINTLCDVEALSLENIPFYAHLVSTLDSVFPEITQSVCCFLRRELNYCIEKKEKGDLLRKLKVLKFVVALIEWQIFFDFESLNCLKLFLTTYKPHWSEFYSNDISRLIKLASLIIVRYTNKIETDLLQSGDPQYKLKFISKLIFKDLLVRGNELRILQIIRMLNWDDPEVSDYAVKCLSSPWEVEYNCIEKFACLVTVFCHDFRDIAEEIISSVLTQVQVDTDLNSTNYLRRLSTIKYLGELYNFGLIESATIFDTLYFLVMTGYNPKILPLFPSDPHRSLIRIRAVLILIKTCGDFLSSADKTKLAHFLTYFQYYYWAKQSSPVWSHRSFMIPSCIHSMLLKCCQNYCPNFQLCKSFQEASDALDALKKKIIPETDPKNHRDYSSYFPGFDMHKIRYYGDEILNNDV